MAVNDTDYQAWFDYHLTRFPDISRWGAKKPGTLETWRLILRVWELDELQSATDALQRGDIEAGGYAMHPATINSFLAKKRREENERLKERLARQAEADLKFRDAIEAWIDSELNRE